MTTTPERLRGHLVVSCQAAKGGPLDRPAVIAALAAAAVQGGAGGVRVGGVADIRAVRRVVDVPIIGLIKRRSPLSPVYITPTIDDAARVADAGADMVAIDATDRRRPDGRTAAETIARLLSMGLLVVADVDDIASAVAAEAAGAQVVATTLSGYTGGRVPAGPDIELVGRIAGRVRCPLIAEGRYRLAAHVRAAFRAGAHAVVIGNAITDTAAITARFVAATPRAGRRHPPGEPDA